MNDDAQPDLSTFPVRRRSAHLDKFTVGDEFEHHWGRTLTTADNTVFSSITCHWNPMYINAEFARAHGHRDAVVNPMLVLCTVIGLSVEDLSEDGGPFVGVEDCEFEQAVYPGDTLTARSTVLESRDSNSRPGFGLVTWSTEAHNQHGERVLRYVRTNLLQRADTVVGVTS